MLSVWRRVTSPYPATPLFMKHKTCFGPLSLEVTLSLPFITGCTLKLKPQPPAYNCRAPLREQLKLFLETSFVSEDRLCI